ncbi:HAMP domain-containing histidine kinase [Dactylosporangium aurantiacum]|uniref:histidine kinase n=1 Tax=Dactylosporangium aurantiacum TaxID=35754 RepID=A0A9Q9INS3_9ACTN|nr:HAMP domain-containing sensor histidine kinase [Dactylosporangium aurantiacum]MDG6109958.1 HAMP domain-containing sensor histidine kinase [Dactylosporangium aurantiacum]UWZ57290.1 HAMP domain-containing histidine kinase [Dactylosporangium aurantiacum]
MKKAGLRTRVVAGFAAGALALSASMAFISYELTRGSLLAGRERAMIRATAYDARIITAGLDGERPDVVAVLKSLDTGGNRRTLLRRDGGWYTRNADPGAADAVPAGLQRLVEQGGQGAQWVRVDGVPALVIGVSLSPTTALYEIDYLRELDQTLRTLAWVLGLVAAAVAAAGAGLGWYATRYVLRPLRSVADAAQGITDGDLSARLDPATEPDLARLTESFNGMVDQLARRHERDRRFAADVSHELRSPLQTLAASASVLHRRRAHLDERTALAAGLVVEEIGRFQQLVDDLLELARSDQPARRAPVDPHDLARRVVEGQGLDAGLVEPAAEDGVRWLVDRRRVEQILANLLDNAVRHGGGPVAVRLTSVGGTGRVEVDDEGPGVRPDDRLVIFDRFVRGRSAGARGGGDGTGLGLSLVARHAAAHGGRVVVLDRPGGGARFRVELPGAVP